MAKSQMVYAKFKITTPALEASFPSLSEVDEYSQKYQIKVIMDETSQCQAMLKKLLDFQNDCLEVDGKARQDDLFGLKSEMSKNEKTEEWDVPTGRTFLTFKSANQSKFDVVGPNARTIDGSTVGGGDKVHVKGQAAFGYFQKSHFVTLYLNGVQLVSSGGGGSSFEDLTGGEGADDVPFSNEFENEVELT